MWVVKGTSTVSEPVSPTKQETKPVDSGHKKILRERERKPLFIQGLPHALYVLPHLILTDKVL